VCPAGFVAKRAIAWVRIVVRLLRIPAPVRVASSRRRFLPVPPGRWWLAAALGLSALGCAGGAPTEPGGLDDDGPDGPYGPRPGDCEPGFRDHGSGECRPANPCLAGDPCAPSRTCWNDGEGRASCGGCRDGYVAVGEGECAPDPGPHDYVGPARAGRERLALWDQEAERYRPRFLRGVDLGVGVPGHTPGSLAVTRDQYRRWLDQMREGGLDTIRVYTIHFPRFYEELRRHNLAHPEAPLYLMQGVWLGESATEPDHDLHRATEVFDAEIERAVDVVHGAADIPDRSGHGHGVFTADVSPWTIGFLIGREVFSREVRTTDRLHPDDRRFEGQAFTLADGNPSSVWMAARLDHIVASERARHGAERPVAFSNWLELDPIDHPTEPDRSGKDVAEIDLSRLDASRAPAGHFVSFHVYPYYPHYVNEDPVYRTYADELGPNPYLGILDDLRRYYRGKPVLVAEYGVPSSWGLAKHADSGMHHGGHTEHAQGVFAARMLRNIHDTGLAGALYFHWMDGWFKRIWILNDRTFPASRLPLWPDLTNPQQNYGLVSFDPPGPDWDGTPPVPGEGRVRGLRGTATADGFHVEVVLDAAPEVGDRLTLGFDTYGDDLGASVLPGGEGAGGRQVELALSHVVGTDEAALQVIAPYDLRGIPRGRLGEDALGRSLPMEGDAGWRVLRWNTAMDRCSDDGRWCFPAWDEPVGLLRARRVVDGDDGDTAPPTSQDALVVDGATVRVMIPWTFLQLTDPSRRMVFADDPTTDGWDAVETPGIALVVTVTEGSVGGGDPTDAGVDDPPQPAGRAVTGRIGWAPWDEPPPTTERLKAGAPLFFDAVRSLP